MERVLDLTLKLADEGLSPDEQGELERLIEAEPLARRRHLQMLEVEATLRAAGHPSARALQTRPSDSLADERRVAAVLQTIRKPRWLSWRRGNRLRTVALAGAVAAAAALALVGLRPLARRPQGQPAVMARTAVPAASSRREQPVVSGRRGWSVAVLPVQAAAPADHVKLELGDDATLEVRGRAVLGIERAAVAADDGTASRVTLEEGIVAYHRPGTSPAAQTAISTPHADVLVRGGRALVAVTAEHTRVNVLDGQATVITHGGGSASVVARHGTLVAGGRASPAALPSVLLLVGQAPNHRPEQLLDQVLLRRLETLGFAADVVGERSLRPDHLQRRQLLVISPTVTSHMQERAQELSLAQAPVPILCSRPKLYQDLGMTSSVRGSADFSKQKKFVTIRDTAHPLAAGLRGEVEVMNTNMIIGWGVPAAGATRVALMRDNADHAAIFAFEREAPLLTGHAAARRTGFFLHPTAVGFMKAEAWQLFDAAVRWTAGDLE